MLLTRPYALLIFWTICITLRVEARSCEVLDRNGEKCGTIVMNTTTSEEVMGQFALLAVDDQEFWALLLEWEDGITERRGMAKLRKPALVRCLPPGPRWKLVVLG
jgi:hypothetical protein